MQVDVWLLAREVIAQSSDLQGSSFGEHRAASQLQVPSTLRLHPTGPHTSLATMPRHIRQKDFSAYLNPQGASANFRLHVAEKIEAAFAVATEKTFTLDRNKKKER